MKRIRPPIEKSDRGYRQLWRVVDGAITDALNAHPEYLAPRGRLSDNARRSIAKRVTGAILGYAEQSAKGRSGARSAAELAETDPTLPPAVPGLRPANAVSAPHGNGWQEAIPAFLGEAA